jgi:hypothetical protein
MRVALEKIVEGGTIKSNGFYSAVLKAIERWLINKH